MLGIPEEGAWRRYVEVSVLTRNCAARNLPIKRNHENHHDSHFLAFVAAFGRDNLISGKGSFRRFSCRVGVRQPYTSYGRTASRPCHRSGGSPVSLHRLVQDPQIISNAIAPMLKVTLWILVLIC